MHTIPGSARCAACSAPLPAHDAVCPACDAALQDSNNRAARARHRCPGCHAAVQGFESLPWPPDAPWYHPTGSRLRCPLCHVHVRSRHNSRAFRGNLAGLYAVVLFVAYATRHDPELRPLSLLALAATLCWSARHAYREWRTPGYVVDEGR